MLTALPVCGWGGLQLDAFGLWLQLSLPLLPLLLLPLLLLLRLRLRTKISVALGVGGVLWRRVLLVVWVTIAGFLWRRRAGRRSHPRGTRVGTKAAITAAAGIKASVGSIRCQRRGNRHAAAEGKEKDSRDRKQDQDSDYDDDAESYPAAPDIPCGKGAVAIGAIDITG